MRRLLAALAVAGSGYAAAVEVGAPVPAVAMPRLGETAASIPLAGFRGKVVYVDFWASWCVPCRLSMPALDALYKRNQDRGFVVVGVNKDVRPADARRFLERIPVTFALAGDAGDEAARAFDVKAMPSGYLIDRKGMVRRVHRGFTAETAAELEREVETLLKEPS